MILWVISNVYFLTVSNLIEGSLVTFTLNDEMLDIFKLWAIHYPLATFKMQVNWHFRIDTLSKWDN